MKSLLIERVQNGWIVRPYTINWEGSDQNQKFVFTSIPDLLTGLCPLLSDQAPVLPDFDDIINKPLPLP